jgi:hypothetical protein
MSLPLVAAAFGLLIHIGGGEVRGFEGRAAQFIKSTLSGEQAKVSVKTSFASLFGGPFGELDKVRIAASDFSCPSLPLFAEPDRSKVGRIRELSLSLTDFELAGLRVSRLEAVIPGCRYDHAAAVGRRGFHVSRSGTGTAKVWIDEGALAEYARKKFPMIGKLAVKIDKDKLFVDGSAQLVLAKTEFSVIAGLAVQNGSQLVLTTPRVFLDGRRSDGPAVVFLESLFDPVIDLDEDLGLFGAMTIESMRLRGGVLEVSGAFHLPARPR